MHFFYERKGDPPKKRKISRVPQIYNNRDSGSLKSAHSTDNISRRFSGDENGIMNLLLEVYVNELKQQE